MKDQISYTESGTPNARITVRAMIGTTGWVLEETRRIDFARENASYPRGDFLGRRSLSIKKFLLTGDVPGEVREWAEELPGIGKFCHSCQEWHVPSENETECPHCGAVPLGNRVVVFTPVFNHWGEPVGFRQPGWDINFHSSFYKDEIPTWGVVVWPFRTGGNGHPAEIKPLPPFLGDLADRYGQVIPPWPDRGEFDIPFPEPCRGEWGVVVTPEMSDEIFSGVPLRKVPVGNYVIQGYTPFKKRLRQVRDRLNKMTPGDGGRERLEEIANLLK